MLTRKKSIVLCFVIGSLLCTLISCGSRDDMSAKETKTATPTVAEGLAEAEIQDIRKTSLEENTREIVKTAIKSTESDSGQNQETLPEALAAKIAGASVKGGVADYGTAVQNEQVEQTDGVQQMDGMPQTEGAPAGGPEEEQAAQAEAIAPELENKVVTTVVDTYLNIRQEPSEDSEILGRLYEGSAGEVLETAEGWTKISSGGVEGWVHNEYVVSGEAAQTFAEESLRQVATVKEEGVRVRAGASLDSPWVGMVDMNESYRIVPEEPAEEEETEEAASEPESSEAPEETTEAPIEEAAPEASEASVPEESGEAVPAALEAPIGSEALVVPETGEPVQETENSEPAPESQAVEGQEVPEGTELKWIKIVYDGDKEGYVCADYVTTSFVLGKAKSMEEIREEEAAAARAAAEKEAAERAARAKARAEEDTSSSSAGSGWVSLGEFKITAYCGGACCNGQWAGTTSSGAVPTEGRTIAVAPGMIPYGTQVKIAGLDGVYVAEDTGGFASSNPRQIDVYYADHNHATSRGVSYREIWVKR